MSRPDRDTEDTEEEWLTPHRLTVSVVQEAVMPVLDTGIHELSPPSLALPLAGGREWVAAQKIPSPLKGEG